MSVYVDSAKNKYGRMQMCHMIGDTVEELHKMADKIQIRREWFQNNGTPHYDICQSKRNRALRAGALVMDRKKTVELIRMYRKQNAAN